MNELVREGVIVEATDNIAIVSNLLPVSKPTANYSLKSKIDKSLQLNSKQNMNRSRITLDIKECNKYINTSAPLPLPKISQIKNKMNNMLFSALDLSMKKFTT